MSITFYTLACVIGVSLLSLLGIVFLLFDDKHIRKVLLYLVSISTGALLGDVFIHIVPELAESPDTFGRDLYVLLGGMLFSFVLEKFIHWRHCHMTPAGHHHHDCDEHVHHHHPMGLVSTVGEGIHNFIDGLVIAAAFVAGIPVGFSTALAVMFHEIPHEIGNVAVLLHSGYPRKKAILFNCLSAAMSILGAVAVLVFASSYQMLAALMLPFAAGNLLYIAGSDLIPELHKESRPVQAILQLVCIILGMLVMYGIKQME